MPHLSPLSWALAPIIFWSILLTLSSTLWWSSTPSFPSTEKNSTEIFSTWSWN